MSYNKDKKEKELLDELQDRVLLSMYSTFIDNNKSFLMTNTLKIFYSHKNLDELEYTIDSYNTLIDNHEKVKEVYTSIDVLILDNYLSSLKKRKIYKNLLYKKIVKFFENLFLYNIDIDFLCYMDYEFKIIKNKIWKAKHI